MPMLILLLRRRGFRRPVLDRAAGLGWRNHRHWSCPFWAAPADNPITLLAAACRKRFDRRLLLTARDRTIAPTMVERTAMALSVESSPSGPPIQEPSRSR